MILLLAKMMDTKSHFYLPNSVMVNASVEQSTSLSLISFVIIPIVFKGTPTSNIPISDRIRFITTRLYFDFCP